MLPRSLVVHTPEDVPKAIERLRLATGDRTQISMAVVISQKREDEVGAMEELFGEPLLRYATLISLFFKQWHFEEISTSALQRLAACGAFAHLRELSFWRGSLTAATLFEMLSLAPALQSLSIHQISDESGDDDAYPAETLAAPACSLTHLSVYDDCGIDFMHCPLLLSKSHDTLEHLNVSWTFDPTVDDRVVEAVSHCSRLRSLEIIGNNFSTAAIIAACPRLQCLALAKAPSSEEIAALRDARTLRELRLVCCFGTDDDDYIGRQWPRLQDAIQALPGLRIIRLAMQGDARKRCPISYPLLRAECARRRILLFTTLVAVGWGT